MTGVVRGAMVMSGGAMVRGAMVRGAMVRGAMVMSGNADVPGDADVRNAGDRARAEEAAR